MSEETLRYDVEVYDGDGDLAESYSDLTEETVTVPSSILGPAAPEITFSVWQRSTIVGRGFEASGTFEGAEGIGNWRQSSDTTYLAYISGSLPNDLPELPLNEHPGQTVALTAVRLRYSGFVIDLQWQYTPTLFASNIGPSIAYYSDDGDGGLYDRENFLYRSWLNVKMVKDDGAAGYFFASYIEDAASYITRFPADSAINWSSYLIGQLGPVTQTTLPSTYFQSLVSLGASVWAIYAATSTLYKYANTDLSVTGSWSKPGASVLFKHSTDLWMATGADIAKVNQSTAAETGTFTVADDVADAVAVGGYVYAYLPGIQKVKKYELATGTVQAFEYDYTDSENAFIYAMPVLTLDGTLLSIGRAYVEPSTGDYVGSIVVVDTITDEII
jgi:hypothetical protein